MKKLSKIEKSKILSEYHIRIIALNNWLKYLQSRTIIFQHDFEIQKI